MTIQFVGFGLDVFQNVLRLLSAQHQDDAFDGVIIFLKAEFAQARRVPDGDFANVAHPNGHAFIGADDDVSNVIGIAHQSDAANVIELSALRIETAAGIGVVGGERRR